MACLFPQHAGLFLPQIIVVNEAGLTRLLDNREAGQADALQPGHHQKRVHKLMFMKLSQPARLPSRAQSVWLLGRADRHRRALEDGKEGSGDDSLRRSISRFNERETQRCGWTSKQIGRR